MKAAPDVLFVKKPLRGDPNISPKAVDAASTSVVSFPPLSS
jgi:hypothetical protein